MTLAGLVHAAAAGDEAAWNALVERFGSLVWATARAHRLSRDDAAEVAQTTWLRLVENLGRLRDPERVGAWLATTARRESLRLIRLHARELSSDTLDAFESRDEGEPDAALLVEERDRGLWRAFGRLGDRCQALLRLLTSLTEPSYDEVSAALGIPVGAIGPTRMRCLEKLRSLVTADPAFQPGAA